MLTLLVDHEAIFDESEGELHLVGVEPTDSRRRLKHFVLMDDGRPVVNATLFLNDANDPPIAIIKGIQTDSRYMRKGYSTRMTEMLAQWGHDNGGYRLQSDWDLSSRRKPFWLKQVAKGRAILTNPDDPSETAYRLTTPPGTNLDGAWRPWSPPWGRR